jgi:hypothetical protein
MSPDADRLALESFAFLVEFPGAPGGLVWAGFQSCVIGRPTPNTVAFRSSAGQVFAAPGSHAPSGVTFRRGLAPLPGLTDWAQSQTANGHSVTIRLRDKTKAIVQTWELHGVRIDRLDGTPDLDGRNLAIEELSLHCASLRSSGRVSDATSSKESAT